MSDAGNQRGNHQDTNTALSAEESKYLTDHSYDGIREFDFPLPNWWLLTFVGTVVFGAIYYVVYQFGFAPNLNQELVTDLAVVKQQQSVSSAQGAGGADVNALLAAALQDQAKVAAGKQVFTEKCAACHGANGQGQIGPNLTDDYWINGKGTLADIKNVIDVGVAAKGMPPWGPVLKPEELINVTAYVKSMKGSNPADAKAPQGDLVKD